MKQTKQNKLIKNNRQKEIDKRYAEVEREKTIKLINECILKEREE